MKRFQILDLKFLEKYGYNDRNNDKCTITIDCTALNIQYKIVYFEESKKIV
jgi:hypothetical protein